MRTNDPLTDADLARLRAQGDLTVIGERLILKDRQPTAVSVLFLARQDEWWCFQMPDERDALQAAIDEARWNAASSQILVHYWGERLGVRLPKRGG